MLLVSAPERLARRSIPAPGYAARDASRVGPNTHYLPATITKDARRPTGGTLEALLPRRFQPALTLGSQLDLLALVEQIRGLNSPQAVERVGEAVGVVESRRLDLLEAGVEAADLRPTVAHVAALRMLRDLLAQGWEADRDRDGVLLTPPLAALGPADDPSAAKGAVRESFSFARRAQLAGASTARFVRDMERRGIRRLFADGPELADRLGRAAVGAIPVDEAVSPRLEAATADQRDPHTGLRLLDIWRYARLYWSIPHHSTPGRNLFYLVRDDAAPGAPLIGIAALGNAVLGLSARDDALGWSVDAFARRVLQADEQGRAVLLAYLEAVVATGFSNVLADDLPVRSDRGARSAEALRAVERAATRARSKALLEAGDEPTEDYDLIRGAHNAAADDEEVDWEQIARTDLYRRKRAGTLADLVEAETALRDATSESGPDGLLLMLDDHDGRRALDSILRRVKQRAIAENVMEITTCGAVAPYGEVLGGKLVAMLLCSPQVVRDFAERYTGRASLIASGLAGRPVRRPARLSLLTTSSLYSVGSSQYNRVRIPGTVLGGHGQVAYERLGTTASFGTVHFAPDTARTLVVLAKLAADNRRVVNNLFGEGMSPKLRSLRGGVEALGLPADVFLRHHSPRLLYGVPLAHNTDETLLGLAEEAEYVLSPGQGDGINEIAAEWRRRWLTGRIQRTDVLERVRGQLRDEFLLGTEVDAATRSYPADETRSRARAHAPEGTSPSEFVERLYRSTNSYADRLSDEDLRRVDVNLGLGEHLLKLAGEARQIVVTGNPGDGKTHLIRSLRDELAAAGALVLEDANVLTDEEILEAWRTCDREGRALVLAINEWPLFALRQSAMEVDFAPLREALRQVQAAIYFDEAPEQGTGSVRVIDLGLRNVLAPPIVGAVIDRLCARGFYEGLHADDPALGNRAALLETRVRERLFAILERVAQRGHHATMRQLVGFIAYLLTGGRPAVERLTHQGSDEFRYSTLTYRGGVGPLFDAVRNALDPASLTHPDHDLDLWRGASRPDGWLDPRVGSAGLQELPTEQRAGAYVALKRRFFFEHEDGSELLRLLPADEGEFDALAQQGEASSPTAVRDLILALNRFFEPDSVDRERFTLWQSHRFDVRAPDTFVALREIDRERFRLLTPAYAPWVEEWLPDDQRLTRSFALTVDSRGADATLLLDRTLYLTLAESRRGLGRAGWSRSATRRVTRFVDRLQRLEPEEDAIADIRVRNVETDLDDKFEVQRQPPRFNL